METSGSGTAWATSWATHGCPPATRTSPGKELRLRGAGAIKVFTDVRSGRSMDRPGPAALLDYARRGDTLAVVRLDRLGRSLTELLATVAMLKERGIALLSLEERIDTASAAGELVFHVFGAIAHLERRLIAERTKDGIAAARPRQASGAPAARPGQGRGGAEARGGRSVADRGRPAGRPRALDRLPRAPARRGGSPHAGHVIRMFAERSSVALAI